MTRARHMFNRSGLSCNRVFKIFDGAGRKQGRSPFKQDVLETDQMSNVQRNTGSSLWSRK